jgi:hypothetical protein
MLEGFKKAAGAFFALCLFGVGSATAAPITFTDVWDAPGSGVTLNSSNRTYSFTHNIINPAGDPQGDIFNPLTDMLTSATLLLNFRDDECDPSLFCWFGNTEEVSLNLDGTNLPSFEVDSGDVSFVINLAMLADGLLNVDINWKSGDVRFDESILTAKGDRSSAPPTGAVPEPGSLVLLGSGLVGMGIFIKRKTKHRS